MPKGWGGNAQAVGTRCPSGGEAMPKGWGDNAQGLGSSYKQALLEPCVLQNKMKHDILFRL